MLQIRSKTYVYNFFFKFKKFEKSMRDKNYCAYFVVQFFISIRLEKRDCMTRLMTMRWIKRHNQGIAWQKDE